jgi:ribosome maturation factor RimP
MCALESSARRRRNPASSLTALAAIAVLTFVAVSEGPIVLAWTVGPQIVGFASRKQQQCRPSITALNAGAEDEMRDEGSRIIVRAAVECGAQEEQVLIEWKAGRIVVTVDGMTSLASGDLDIMDDEGNLIDLDDLDDDDLDNDYEDDEVEDDDELYYDEDEGEGEDEEEGEDLENLQENENNEGPSVTSIARAINKALDESEIGQRIAEVHAIEVTTPGGSDVVSGPIMFEAYKGFDVTVETQDTKTNKKKVLEGKLVSRDDKFTTINVKGRVKKLNNNIVECIRLPKAKKEKGAK